MHVINITFNVWQSQQTIPILAGAKTQKVVRVITVYAAAAFVILELVDIICSNLGLPEWTLNLDHFLLCVGFIITVIVSWMYDVHPEEDRKDKASS